MATYSNLKKPEVEPTATGALPASTVHPAWLAFIRFCRELRHGEIDQLKIQDGLPLLAEVTKKKVKFT
jgi:hypothetical protein